jgi:hypothetical protein
VCSDGAACKRSPPRIGHLVPIWQPLIGSLGDGRQRSSMPCVCISVCHPPLMPAVDFCPGKQSSHVHWSICTDVWDHFCRFLVGGSPNLFWEVVRILKNVLHLWQGSPWQERCQMLRTGDQAPLPLDDGWRRKWARRLGSGGTTASCYTSVRGLRDILSKLREIIAFLGSCSSGYHVELFLEPSSKFLIGASAKEGFCVDGKATVRPGNGVNGWVSFIL